MLVINKFCKLFFVLLLLGCFQWAKAEGKPTDSLRIKAEKLATKDFDQAILLSDKGIELSGDEVEKSVFYRIKGLAYYFKGDFKKASELYNKAILIQEKNNQQKELGLTFIEQAKLYRKTKMLEAAEKTYQRALNIFTTLRDTANMATVLNESGVVQEYKKDYNRAINLYQQSYDLNKKLKDTIGMAYSLGFIGGAKLQEGDLKLAEDFAKQSLQLFMAKQDSFAIAIGYTNLSEIATSAGQTNKAKNYLLNSTRFAERIQFLDLMANNYMQLSKLYKKEGKTDSSVLLLEKYTATRDSIYNSNMQKTVLELNTKYDTVQKDKEILEKKSALKLKNILLLASVVALILGGLLFVALMKSSKFKHKNELQKTLIDQQDIATKAVIKAEENERVRMSATLHDGLGQLLSATKMNVQALETVAGSNSETENSYIKVISLLDDSIKEMRAVSHQMMPGAVVRSGLGNALKELIEKMDSKALEINLNVEGLEYQPDEDVQIVLYRIFQECINNVIKHAKATKLFISLIQSPDSIDATIEDNGVGFNMADLTDKHGIGLQNIRTRVNFLKGDIDISSARGKGTLIAFHIPLKQ